MTAVAGLGGTGRAGAKLLWGSDGPQVRFLKNKLQTNDWEDAQARDKMASGEEALRLLYVAMRRAQDHLILGCYHKPGGTPSHAQRLVTLLPEALGLVRVEPSHSESPESADMSPPAEATAFAAAGPVSPVDFDAERGALLADVVRRTDHADGPCRGERRRRAGARATRRRGCRR